MMLNKYYLVLIMFAATMCKAQQGVSTYTLNFNDHIDSKSRAQIKLLDDQLISAIHNGDKNILISIFSERLKSEMATANFDFLNTLKSLITDNKYEVLDDYLYTAGATGDSRTVFKSKTDDNAYQVSFKEYSKETYISLLTYTGPIETYLFTAIYGKYNEEWKLDIFRVGLFKLLGKSAIDFYKQAKINFANGDVMDAAINLRLTQRTSAPAENNFFYFKIPEIKEFDKKISTEGMQKYPLPYTIIEVETKPQIFDIQPAIIDEGVFPEIYYRTTVKLEDTIALKAENDKIIAVIGKIFPGVDKNKKYVFFKAYNELPNGKTPVHRYGFIYKTEEKLKPAN